MSRGLFRCTEDVYAVTNVREVGDAENPGTTVAAVEVVAVAQVVVGEPQAAGVDENGLHQRLVRTDRALVVGDQLCVALHPVDDQLGAVTAQSRPLPADVAGELRGERRSPGAHADPWPVHQMHMHEALDAVGGPVADADCAGRQT